MRSKRVVVHPAEEAEEAKRELIQWKLIRPIQKWSGPQKFTDPGHMFLLHNKNRLEADMSEMDDFFPDTLFINGIKYRGQRVSKDQTVLIPCNLELAIAIGSTVEQKTAAGPILLKVVDKTFRPGAGIELSDFPHLMILYVRNLSAEEHQAPRLASISIGHLSGTGIQIGERSRKRFR